MISILRSCEHEQNTKSDSNLFHSGLLGDLSDALISIYRSASNSSVQAWTHPRNSPRRTIRPDVEAKVDLLVVLIAFHHRMLNLMGTVNSNVSPGIFGGGGGNGCARWTVAMVS